VTLALYMPHADCCCVDNGRQQELGGIVPRLDDDYMSPGSARLLATLGSHMTTALTVLCLHALLAHAYVANMTVLPQGQSLDANDTLCRTTAHSNWASSCLSVMYARAAKHTVPWVANRDVPVSAGLDNGSKVFDRVPHRDAFLWNVMLRASVREGSTHEALALSSCGSHGHGVEALDVFQVMLVNGIATDAFFVSIPSACAHCGRVEGLRVFDMMDVHGVVKRQVHYACVVDLLGHAGQQSRSGHAF
jgi:pentatricopeptide repeat protein